MKGTFDITCEGIRESVRELKELHWEDMQERWPHQMEMVCQFWALADAGIKDPGTTEELEQEGEGRWGESSREWKWEAWKDPEPTENAQARGAHRKEYTAEEDKGSTGIWEAAGDTGTSGKEEATVEDASGTRAMGE